MRFSLVDRITDVEPDVRITAVKTLSLAEEYLADHFPSAPVMPGVMMLESLIQTAAWLIRGSEDFAHSMVILKEARGVKFANFVEPGQTLTITAEIQSQTDREIKFKARGEVAGAVAVSAKIVMEKYNLAAEKPEEAATDAFIIEQLRRTYALLCPVAPSAA